MRFCDPRLVVDLAFGLPALGWSAQAPTMLHRYAPPEVSIESLLNNVTEHNQRLIGRTGPSRDIELDLAAWAKTEEELSLDMLQGPWESLDEVPVDNPRLIRRFGTWEQHGGAIASTCRLIDDALEGGQNEASGSFYTHRPTDLDALAAQIRRISETFPAYCCFKAKLG